MKKNFHVVIVCCIFLITGCTAGRHISSIAQQDAGLYPYGPLWATLWQQQSGEYKALCFQAYHLARLRLDESLKAPGVEHPAVITDIDETILDNSPYEAHQALDGGMYSDSSWMQWTAKASADPVPGAVSFFQYAARRGVAVYYITNRIETEWQATLQNLQKWGFPDADNEHLLLKTNTSDKDARRQRVAKDHQVLLYIGDNLADFSGIFKKPYEERNKLTTENAPDFGENYIILPNPMYGDWEGALYNYQYGLPVSKKNEMFRKALKSY